MEQNQDKKDQLQPQEIPGAEVKENSENKISEQSTTVPDTKEETPPTPQPEIQNTELQTDQMEVHKHPHHITHKKKWPEYLLEFLMIFLAVFLGFIAENIRERLTEKQREKEYILSMVEDLRTDTAKFNRAIPANQGQINGYDSLIAAWYHRPYSDTCTRMMYYLYRRYTATTNPMVFAMRSFDQLKNAGGMQFIRNKIASDSILQYYNGVERLNRQLDFFRDQSVETLKTSYSIFDWSYLKDISNSTLAYKILAGNKRISFLNASAEEQNRYMGELQLARSVLGNYFIYLTDQRTRCLRLMDVLHEQYHL